MEIVPPIAYTKAVELIVRNSFFATFASVLVFSPIYTDSGTRGPDYTDRTARIPSHTQVVAFDSSTRAVPAVREMARARPLEISVKSPSRDKIGPAKQVEEHVAVA